MGEPGRSEYKSKLVDRATASMRKLQTQGVHHITLVGAEPADVDRLLGRRARHAVRLRAAEPRQRVREPSLLRSRRRPADHRVHGRGARAGPEPHADRPRLRAPHRVCGLAGDVRPGGGTTRRARHQAQRRQGPRLHGFDLFRGSARPADRARVLPLRAAGRLHPCRRAARGAQAARRARRLQHRPTCISPMRSSARRTLAGVALGGSRAEEPLSADARRTQWPPTR